MAAGTIAVAGLYAFLFLTLGAPRRLPRSIAPGSIWITVILAVVFVHGTISYSINDAFDLQRFLQSHGLLVGYLVGAFSLAFLVEKVCETQAHSAVKFVFFGLILSGVAGILGYAPFSGVDVRQPVLLFAEPSGFALSFLPFLLYMVVLSNSRVNWLLLVLSVLLAILLKSLTLIVGVGLIMLVVLPVKRLVFLVPLVAVLVVAVNAVEYLNLGYYSERVDLSRENTNLSALAFMQGWETAYLNIKETFGFGVGFQQFGIVGSRGEIAGDLFALLGEDLNRFDGSMVASKLVGEFGIAGVMALLVYLYYFSKSAKLLHYVSTRGVAPRNRKQVFVLACFVMYWVDLFVRGAGYFSSSGFLFFASVFCMTFDNLGNLHPTIPKLRMLAATQNA